MRITVDETQERVELAQRGRHRVSRGHRSGPWALIHRFVCHQTLLVYHKAYQISDSRIKYWVRYQARSCGVAHGGMAFSRLFRLGVHRGRRDSEHPVVEHSVGTTPMTTMIMKRRSDLLAFRSQMRYCKVGSVAALA